MEFNVGLVEGCRGVGIRHVLQRMLMNRIFALLRSSTRIISSGDSGRFPPV